MLLASSHIVAAALVGLNAALSGTAYSKEVSQRPDHWHELCSVTNFNAKESRDKLCSRLTGPQTVVRMQLVPGKQNSLTLTVKPNIFSAMPPISRAAHAAMVPSKHWSKT